MPVRFESELDPLLILKPPLLANFSIRNDPLSNQLTGALYRIVQDETEKIVSVVDVEADEPGVQDVISRYQVNDIPTIVALRSGIPFSRYAPKGDKVDWIELKQWVESVADPK
ncbi:hypothetical protein TRVA0_001S04940 [Trichomonascus vanleenenianus]|uniref:uncharacterized protein n=1 Tax=Trichomonascus vanleenenianus TaxID=2268995 RepID=UPI003EC9AB1E